MLDDLPKSCIATCDKDFDCGGALKCCWNDSRCSQCREPIDSDITGKPFVCIVLCETRGTSQIVETAGIKAEGNRWDFWSQPRSLEHVKDPRKESLPQLPSLSNFFSPSYWHPRRNYLIIHLKVTSLGVVKESLNRVRCQSLVTNPLWVRHFLFVVWNLVDPLCLSVSSYLLGFQ